MKLEAYSSESAVYDKANTLQGQKILVLDDAIQRSLNNDLNGVIQLES